QDSDLREPCRKALAYIVLLEPRRVPATVAAQQTPGPGQFQLPTIAHPLVVAGLHPHSSSD
ncbi:MAG: hypothetical protein ACK48X_06360, partial [Planctomycetota bacterium]